jgi:hypothetical protein
MTLSRKSAVLKVIMIKNTTTPPTWLVS